MDKENVIHNTEWSILLRNKNLGDTGITETLVYFLEEISVE